MTKLNKRNISEEEGDTIKNVVNTLIDILVKMTGGKPWFGKNK